MRRALPLASELRTDDNAGGDIDIMTYYSLRVDDDTAEVGKIETLADICIVGDLEMIFT